MEITPLRAISPHQHRYRIKVSVARVWRPRRYNSEAYDGLHYVFIDENGDSIHAYIDENQHDDMTQKVELGQLYDIYRISTLSNHFRQFKIVDKDVELKLNGSTGFVKLQDTPTPIPQYSFRLIEFEDLAKEKEGQKIYTDVYGCITDAKVPYRKTVTNQKKVETKCDITLLNLRRQTLKITLWGDIARSIDMGSLQRSTTPVFAVFTSLKLGQWDKRVTANCSNHTCIFLNPDLPVTEEYKIEFSRPGDMVHIIGAAPNHQSNEALGGIHLKTVSELNAINPLDYQDQHVHCNASIRRFSTRNGWWYRSCSGPQCIRTLQKKEEHENKYFCVLHGLQKPRPSYLVSMIIEDKESQATLTLMGKEANQLFKTNCEELLNKRHYPTELSLPEEIVEQEGQTYQFEIKVKSSTNFIVKGITPNTVASKAAVNIEPTNATPDHPHSERKRTGETSRRVLFLSESEKKSKREVEDGASSSSNPHEEQKEKID